MKKKHHDWHHKKPLSKGGDDNDRNLVQVSLVQHQAWHTLFRNMTPHEIAAEINKTWLDPEYQFAVLKRNPDRSTTDY